MVKHDKEKQLAYWRAWYKRNSANQIKRVAERKKDVANWLHDYKSTLTCSNCEENHPAALDFHHIDSSKKTVEVSTAAYLGWGINRIKKEISKCVVLCANCHRKLHASERNIN